VHSLHTTLTLWSCKGTSLLHGDKWNILVIYISILSKLCFIPPKKPELLDQDIHRLTFLKTTCNTGFLLHIVEQCVVWLILYGRNSRSFVALWTVDFHIPLWTLNWCKDFLGLLSIWMPISSNIFIYVQHWTCLLDILLCFCIIS